MKRLNFLSVLLFFVQTFFFGSLSSAVTLKEGETLRALPIQADGRIKPFDTFSREMLEIVYGKGSFEGRKAHEIILTWMLSPTAWENKELFEVRNHEVLKALGLDSNRKRFKGSEVFGNEKFTLLRQELREKRESKEKLTPYFQALQRLENQYFVFTEMATGRLMKVVPIPGSENWKSVAELEGEPQKAFMDMSGKFISYIAAIAESQSGSGLSEKAQALDQSVKQFQEVARQQNPQVYANEDKIQMELHYNLFHPFRWAYIFYFIAAAFILILWVFKKNSWMKGAWALVAIGFFLHTYGFALRVYLTGRPPVSNMYETVVWMAWGAVVFSSILEMIYKFRFTLLAGTLAGFIGMVVADSAPIILDPSLQPLEPVLRSNYWLIVHVMTITISYAAFTLAFILGDIGLFYFLQGEEKNKAKIKELVMAVYRSMQIGVVFLAPGIILGGIWADYSWGRFWGWDPKETWALIALLGYIAVLHGRLVGWIRDFGMVVSGIMTFSLVIMAWYGVNFVLGAGLHSYGFGAGGVEYVSGFVIAHFLAIIYVAVLRQSRAKA